MTKNEKYKTMFELACKRLEEISIAFVDDDVDKAWDLVAAWGEFIRADEWKQFFERMANDDNKRS